MAAADTVEEVGRQVMVEVGVAVRTGEAALQRQVSAVADPITVPDNREMHQAAGGTVEMDLTVTITRHSSRQGAQVDTRTMTGTGPHSSVRTTETSGTWMIVSGAAMRYARVEVILVPQKSVVWGDIAIEIR